MGGIPPPSGGIVGKNRSTRRKTTVRNTGTYYIFLFVCAVSSFSPFVMESDVKTLKNIISTSEQCANRMQTGCQAPVQQDGHFKIAFRQGLKIYIIHKL